MAMNDTVLIHSFKIIYESIGENVKRISISHGGIMYSIPSIILKNISKHEYFDSVQEGSFNLSNILTERQFSILTDLLDPNIVLKFTNLECYLGDYCEVAETMKISSLRKICIDYLDDKKTLEIKHIEIIAKFNFSELYGGAARFGVELGRYGKHTELIKQNEEYMKVFRKHIKKNLLDNLDFAHGNSSWYTQGWKYLIELL